MSFKIEANNGWTDKVYYVTRISIVLSFVLLFINECNPVRIFTKMHRNVSLVTAALSYDRLIVNMGADIKKNFFFPSDFYKVMAAAALMVGGILIMSIAACVSLGNIRLKRISNWITVAGAMVTAGGCVMTVVAHESYKVIDTQIASQMGYNFATEALPWAFYAVVGLVALQMLCAFILIIFQPSAYGEAAEMPVKYKLFLLFLPFALLAFMFSYLPLYGWRYAFFEYKSGQPLTMDSFVGFKWFQSLAKNAQTRDDIVRVMKNTLIMSGLGIATSWVAMAFAIFLSEIKCGPFRRIVQVFTTIPNFISWVLVYAIAFAIFSNEGFVNSLMTNITGVVHSRLYLQENSMLYLKMLLWGMWKGMGWSAIIYIAGISGIDQQLYEAATVDGAGRFQKMWHVTLPGLLPTYSVLLLMAVAGILSNGMDQYLVFSNHDTEAALEVLDLYVYNLGIGSGKIPLSTVVGMLKTVVSVTLLFIANGISKLVRGESIM